MHNGDKEERNYFEVKLVRRNQGKVKVKIFKNGKQQVILRLQER